MRRAAVLGALLSAVAFAALSQTPRPRARDLGLTPGILPPGPLNAITDVSGVKVGHATLIRGEKIRTGVTAILPHGGNLFREKVPAAIFVGNGFGKLTGSTQVRELGELETPILLTSTLSVFRVADALVEFLLAQPGNENVRSINPVVGETNDGTLNDSRARPVGRDEVLAALRAASGGMVAEGTVGAGTGTIAFGFKGGIGTASRKLPEKLGGYTVGVLVQTNFGGILSIDGVPVGRELGEYYLKRETETETETEKKGSAQFRSPSVSVSGSVSEGGSIMIVIATDAPVDARNLERMGSRSMAGLARTGAAMTNGSGDYAIAFSTAARLGHEATARRTLELLPNDAMSPLFLATIEATEEAIYNSLFRATSVTSRGRTIDALPIDRTVAILRKYGRIR